MARYHVLSERAVRESGVPWTFLQPNSFMTNTLDWIPQLRVGDVVRAPFADVAVATIDPDDIGATAAAALTSAAHEGRVLPTVREVTGREPRSFEQWARTHAERFRA